MILNDGPFDQMVLIYIVFQKRGDQHATPLVVLILLKYFSKKFKKS